MKIKKFWEVIQQRLKRNHSLTLMPAIDYLMSQLNLAPTAIDRFVVAEGPGSYTGLRFRRDDCQKHWPIL